MRRQVCFTSGKRGHKPADWARPWCYWNAPSNRSSGTIARCWPENEHGGKLEFTAQMWFSEFQHFKMTVINSHCTRLLTATWHAKINSVKTERTVAHYSHWNTTHKMTQLTDDFSVNIHALSSTEGMNNSYLKKKIIYKKQNIPSCNSVCVYKPLTLTLT